MVLRRDFFAGGLATFALSLACGPRSRNPLRVASKAKAIPPYHVFFILGGGIDTIFTADPKTKSEVDAAVDVPFEPSEIIESNGVRLGPHLKALSRWSKHLAIVRGVQTATVSHQPGLSQLHRMRLGVSSYDTRPSLLEIIGAHRSEEQPVPVISFNAPPINRSPGHLSHKTLFGRLLELDPDERAIVTSTLLRQADELAHRHSAESAATAERLRDTARLVDKLRTTPKFEEEKWSDDPVAQDYAKRLQQTAWILENDLALTVELFNYQWDTHTYNTERQGQLAAVVFPMIDRFLDELGKRRSSRGLLLDHTRIILGSELGRHPVLNANLGKHHFPEAPVFLFGPGFATGQAFGQTGRMMQAQPISLRTGRLDRDRGTLIDLDDVGATLLAACDIDPEPYGYTGRVLRFLVG